jgi:hypothetical protein
MLVKSRVICFDFSATLGDIGKGVALDNEDDLDGDWITVPPDAP